MLKRQNMLTETELEEYYNYLIEKGYNIRILNSIEKKENNNIRIKK